ncbi:MAG TPA: type II toxin-antitoxin system HigB family toxin [Bradyrhizobium sp.]|nr:type II toxin-antitoxin system HigB family toxin [Bradyrhizobium sp.]
MRVISQSTLSAFARAHPKIRPSLERWRKLIKAANWNSTNDIRAATGAVILDGERARFEVAGGNYRMIVAFNFKHQIAFIKFLGTHAEYDKIDALTVSIY